MEIYKMTFDEFKVGFDDDDDFDSDDNDGDDGSDDEY